MSTIVSDDDNRVLVGSIADVDDLNARFYGRFPYPWQPVKFDFVEDPEFEIVMLNQDVGSFGHCRIPPDPDVWIAGCGTNQAVEAALRFRDGRVLGSDLAAPVLEMGECAAASIGVKNLELVVESINDAAYRDRFDFIACTGVVHHNTDPTVTLGRVAAALKPTGVLEMMVYNRYHRTLSTAFQKAVRTLGEPRGCVDFDADLALARALARSLPAETRMGQWLASVADRPESDFADVLIQPVEQSYTVESLSALAAAAGLELLLPCVSPLMKYRGLPTSWELELDDPELGRLYDALPDERRWQLANLLLQEQSPWLWFYLQRRDAPTERRTERELAEAFLDAAWTRQRSTQRTYLRRPDGSFTLSPRSVPHPRGEPAPPLDALWRSANGTEPMRSAWRRLGLEPTRARVTRARMQLATTSAPYLRSVGVS